MRWTREDLREGTTVADIASNDDVLSAYAESGRRFGGSHRSG
jgi:hypothetical protein